jgi:hypothetical protein
MARSKAPSIRTIYEQYEPELYRRMRRGCDDFNIFNLAYAKNYYFNLLYTLAVSVRCWEGWPTYFDKAILERILVNNGKSVIHYDELLGKWLCLVLGQVEKYDTNGRPLHYAASTLYGNIVYHDLTPENSAIIWDNITQIPTLASVEFFAGRLANLRMTIDQCVKNLKVPYLIRTTSNNKVVVEAILQEIYNFKPAVIEDGVVDLDALKVYPLVDKIPEALDAARDEFTNTFNEALASLGIANISQEESKHERMTQFEVAKTVTGSMIQQESRLKPALQGAEQVTELSKTTAEPLEVTVSMERIITPIDGEEGESWDESGEQDANPGTQEGGEE